MTITSPDTSGGGKDMYNVKQYYKSGKLNFITGSKSNLYPDVKYEGTYISYYENGNKKKTSTFDDGKIVGYETTFYPNGQLYNIVQYNTDNKSLLKECHDTTGKVLAENGNGHWIDYKNDSFNKYYTEGEVINGLAEGEWKGRVDDSTIVIRNCKNGEIISASVLDNSGKTIYAGLDMVPEFPGGVKGFGKFLAKNIKYPSAARVMGIQGRVIISFVCEKDGTLNDLYLARSIGGGCDEEALRVIKLSPRWKPGIQYGKPVRVVYSVPIAFTLTR